MIEISVVCPVLNEANHVHDIVNFFIRASPKNKELYFIDGGSSDGTLDILRQVVSEFPHIHLINNPKKYVPFALNMAIPKCIGKYVVRIDGHSSYDEDYFDKVIEAFKKSNADIVGGPMRAFGTSDFQIAVAYATSTIFGIGNSNFHFENFEGFTDSVYLGAWKREIFDRIGLFDENLIRNQDDELHYRARAAGLKIYQYPSIRSRYFPRDSILKLSTQYFQYGLFKPYVLRKISSGIKLRHLIPSLFLIYLLLIPILYKFLGPIAFIPFSLYLVSLLIFSVFNKMPIKSKVASLIVYPVLHLTYGFGFILGIVKLLSSAIGFKKTA